MLEDDEDEDDEAEAGVLFAVTFAKAAADAVEDELRTFAEDEDRLMWAMVMSKEGSRSTRTRLGIQERQEEREM